MPHREFKSKHGFESINTIQNSTLVWIEAENVCRLYVEQLLLLVVKYDLFLNETERMLQNEQILVCCLIFWVFLTC